MIANLSDHAAIELRDATSVIKEIQCRSVVEVIMKLAVATDTRKSPAVDQPAFPQPRKRRSVTSSLPDTSRTKNEVGQNR